ncbi:Adenylate kinase 4 [Artemisia annua]|uniref:Adenylate kinase 4 n=1 Tax=Artemisia annua TaxID=35608 RepID=A0A2U1L4X3_ARTAN|nr:Adenylate kinase 4 [Artemisia annua]
MEERITGCWIHSASIRSNHSEFPPLDPGLDYAVLKSRLEAFYKQTELVCCLPTFHLLLLKALCFAGISDNVHMFSKIIKMGKIYIDGSDRVQFDEA